MIATVVLWSLELFRRFLILTRPFSDSVISLIYTICMGRTKPLVPIDNGILLMSATELAKKIRERELKCSDVMHAYIERAQAVQPLINAITDARYAEAMEEARETDRFLDRGEKTSEQIETDTPLLGVPFTCKEVFGIKGLFQTAGVYKAKGRMAEADGDAPSLYRSAGAIPVTVTNVPELCMWWDSANLIFGKTKNPYDNRRIPGGSSGGEGALISTAGAVIGIGSDVGGSIRVPSSFNGIYGHKPSAGIVSNGGHYPFIDPETSPLNHFNTTGPMCRYAQDLPLLFKILTKNDPQLQLERKVDFRNVKVYYMEEFPGNPVVPVIKKSIKIAAKYFEDQFGIKAIPLKLDELKCGLLLVESKFLEVNTPPFKLILADEQGKVNIWLEVLKSMFGMSEHTLPCIYYSLMEKRDKDKIYYECLRQFESLKQKLQDIFSEDAILLIPTHPELAPFYHLTIAKLENAFYTAIINVLRLPATNIPAGMCDNVPFGIQAVSGHCMDRFTIAAALELDKLFGGWKSPSPIYIK